uniref:receptor-type tyrosine-protein phosphatase H n=1 Tax=Pristiophorus japonicus TaxID=55135 RepID=UPI00398EAA5C
MGPNCCWLLLSLTLIAVWEVACSQDCLKSTFRVVPVNTTALKVTWIKVDEGFDLINITLGNDTRTIHDIKVTEVIFSGLEHGQSYDVSITVINTNCSFNATQLVATNPSPVSALSVTGRTTDSLEITWTAPNDTNAQNYTYNITVTSVTGSFTQTNSTGPGVKMFNVTGLEPREQYNLTVESITPENTVSVPATVQGTTNPSPVSALFVTGRTTDSLEITWTAPTDRNASDYTYNITVTSVTGSFTQTNSTGPGVKVFNVTGLEPGEQYNLRVVSVTPENTVSVPATVQGTTNPSPVSALSVTGRTTDSLAVTWTAPNDTRARDYMYNITVTSVTGTFTQTKSTGPGVKVFNVTGLEPGEQYNLTVESVTPENTVSVPAKVQGTTNPSPVSAPSVMSSTADSLEIKWTAPNDTRARDYTYNVTVTSVTGAFTQQYSTGPGETMFNVTGLEPGEQYNLRVESVTPEITTSVPVEVQGTTNPSPVSAPSVMSSTADSLEIKWTAPNDTRARDYTYNVTVTSVMGAFTQKYSTGPGETMFNVTGLEPGEQYNLRVESVTPENTTSVPVGVQGTTNPSPVSALSVMGRTTDSLTITWTTPTDRNASDYTYNITVASVTGSFTQTNSTGAGMKAFNVTGLKPGEQYNLRVVSVTPEKTTSVPAKMKGTTNPSPVSAPSVISSTADSLEIKWTAPNDTRARDYTYNVTVTSVMGAFTQQYSTGPEETMFNVTGLEPGEQYNLRVESVTPEITTSVPVEVQGTTNPSPVSALSVMGRTTDSLTITWTTPTDRNASDYTYNITVASVTGSFTQTNSTGAGMKAFNVTGLKPGEQYNLRVVSVTPEKTTSVPAKMKGTTNPSPVTGLAVEQKTTDSLTLEWFAPSDKRAAIYTFAVKAVSANSSETNRTRPGETSFLVPALIPGVRYNLSVECVTPENTLSVPVNVMDSTIPGAVSEIHCVESTGYMLQVGWTKPRGNFTGFNVTFYDGDHLLEHHVVDMEKFNLTITSLQPGRKYKFNVYTQTGHSYSREMTGHCWTSSSPIIIGAVVGSFLGLILIGLLLFFIIKKYIPWSSRKDADSEFSAMTPIPMRVKSVPLSEYEEYFRHKHADTDFGFAEEYQSLINVGTHQAKDAALLVDNKRKNRYTNVLPYDVSRVKLSPQPESNTSDYINANYMPGYKSDREFIAAQGPLPDTVTDFWRMVWEQESAVIVMLTNCVELNRVKCEIYWPLDDSPHTYGDITVTITSTVVFPEWTLRDFRIKGAGHSETRSVSHFHFTAWPDHGVPETTEKLIEFRCLIREHLNRNPVGPPVVHCSAGVGRTGTLIALDYLLQQLRDECVIDVHGIVHRMRQKRMLMVQTEPQYIFLHQCMLDTIQVKLPEESIYENQPDLIYENVGALNAAERRRP